MNGAGTTPADARHSGEPEASPKTETIALRPFMNEGGMDAAATEQARPVPKRAAGRGVTDSTRTTSDGVHPNDRRASHAASRTSDARAPTVHERRRHEAAVTLHSAPAPAPAAVSVPPPSPLLLRPLQSSNRLALAEASEFDNRGELRRARA